MKKKSKAALWFELFFTFMKIGAFTFGGGYAMIPLIEREAADNKRWISREDILDVVAIAESTPGPIAINAATFVGYKTAGTAGAAFATVGMVLPSFAIILAISFVLRRFESLRTVRYAMTGVQAGVLALILNALVSMYRKCRKYAFSYIIMASSFISVAVFGANVLPVIALCGAAGLIYTLIDGKRRGTDCDIY